MLHTTLPLRPSPRRRCCTPSLPGCMSGGRDNTREHMLTPPGARRAAARCRAIRSIFVRHFRLTPVPIWTSTRTCLYIPHYLYSPGSATYTVDVRTHCCYISAAHRTHHALPHCTAPAMPPPLPHAHSRAYRPPPAPLPFHCLLCSVASLVLPMRFWCWTTGWLTLPHAAAFPYDTAHSAFLTAIWFHGLTARRCATPALSCDVQDDRHCIRVCGSVLRQFDIRQCSCCVQVTSSPLLVVGYLYRDHDVALLCVHQTTNTVTLFYATHPPDPERPTFDSCHLDVFGLWHLRDTVALVRDIQDTFTFSGSAT